MRLCGAPMGALFLFAAKGRIRAIQSLQGASNGQYVPINADAFRALHALFERIGSLQLCTAVQRFSCCGDRFFPGVV